MVPRKEKTGIDIIDGIGATEAYHIFISNHPDDIKPGSSGKPVPGYEVRVVDENWEDVSQGEIGNLILNGESIALSYLHQYEKSKQTFVGEWLFTGDKYFVDEEVFVASSFSGKLLVVHELFMFIAYRLIVS